MKKIVLYILVILWMGFIFLMSSYNGKESGDLSNGFINSTIMKVVNLFDRDMSESDKAILVKKLSYPVRKCAHMTEYFILCLLVCLLIKCYNISINKNIIYSFLICFVYACSDEIHQLFISDRAGQFLDVIIDSIGSVIYLIIYYFSSRRIKNGS